MPLDRGVERGDGIPDEVGQLQAAQRGDLPPVGREAVVKEDGLAVALTLTSVSIPSTPRLTARSKASSVFSGAST